jgi:hypothetical protein
MPIPDGITRADILDALRKIDRGITHDYGPPTRYELLLEGRRYPPKAAIGLATMRLLGRHLSSKDFSGGQGSNQANGRLRALGFEIVPFNPYGSDAPVPIPTMAPQPDAATWTIEPGERLRRQEVHAAYGGAPRGGIEPSGKTPNVLIFSEPEKAGEHSYGFDGWAAPDLLHYTGEGRTGDQRFVDGNRAIRDHRQQRRALRVFRASPPWATYLGQFEVDELDPYLLADSPGVYHVMRQVIIFKLRPVGQFIDGGLGPAPLPPSAPATREIPMSPAEATSRELPVENSSTLGFLASGSGETVEHIRREAALVRRYGSWLEHQGLRHGRHLIQIPGELAVLYTDLFDHSTSELIEAKASASRESVRVGLGQLLDYARFVEHDRRSLLLPTAPRPDLVDLLHAHGCGCIWEKDRGQFERSDP